MDSRSPSPPLEHSQDQISENIILEGSLQFENQAFIKKYKAYWVQIVEQQATTSGRGAQVKFRVLRKNTKIV